MKGDSIKQGEIKIVKIIMHTIIIIAVIAYMIFFCPVPGKSEGRCISNEGTFNEGVNIM